MKKVLVLGAGLVSPPLVEYLLKQPGYSVTLADMVLDKAQALIGGHLNGTAVQLVAKDTDRMEALIRAHDLAVSLLPAPLHPTVAELCVKHGKHMVTASYVSPAMRKLDEAAKQARITILNEIGVDPGIDHMSAMRVIHDIERRGGKVISFKSYCGGLPAPDANDNPWGYKFSWSPRGVCTAGKNAARYRENGQQIDIPGPELFTCHHPLHVDGIGQLEAYPNRDSLGYIDIYGLQGIDTMFRGTLRYPGWCACLKAVVDLGMLAEEPVTYATDTTHAQWVTKLIRTGSPVNIRQQVADFLKIDASANALERMEWLGLFSNEPIAHAGDETTDLDVLAARMNERMPYKKGERDMLVMMHKFVARFTDGKQERHTSTLIDYGRPGGHSSMARTVGLPTAIGAKMILAGEITSAGVHIPVRPEVYNPVLDELALLDIRFEENVEPA
ncbi:MAG: saccharopine dehydrogenase NADP-binding domain-containing protein [Phycisphaerae bacterium]|nr:saccharopine dehydrogenase NADP-binding domain-containing protein [Phycisphaerae bacterium]